jgi:AsmA protein
MPSRPVRLAQAGDDATLRDFSSGVELPRVPSERAGPSDLSLGDIRIDNGTVNYSDARSGSDVRIAAINAEAGLEAITRPLTAKGSFVWEQEQIDFDSVLTSPSELLGARPARLALSLEGEPLKLRYDGSVTLNETLAAEGEIDGSTTSLRRLAGWLGDELPPARGFGEASLAGHLNATESMLRLSNARIGLDGARATGTLSVTTTGAKPYVSADMKVAGLDLGNYMGGEGGSPSPRPAPSPAPQPQGAPAEAPQSIEDLLQDRSGPQSGPQVRGFTQRAGWSGEPIDLAPLALVNADARLAVTDLAIGDVHVEASQLSVALRDSVLKTTFEDVKLYEGSGKGFVTLDGSSGADAAVAANVQLSGIAARPLLKDAAGIDWLAGSGTVTLALSGRGTSEAAIIQSLTGTSDVAVRDGALIGFNLSGAMRALSEGRIPDLETSQSEKTDFSELTGSFVITDGVAKNEDLNLASPLLRATGAGTVDLPARSLDYTVRPKVVASLEGQDGDKGLRGVEVPLHITGSWEEPDIQPDIAGAINDPDTVEAVKEIGKGFKGKKAGEIVEDLLGKGENGEPSKAEKLLEKFLGR